MATEAERGPGRGAAYAREKVRLSGAGGDPCHVVGLLLRLRAGVAVVARADHGHWLGVLIAQLVWKPIDGAGMAASFRDPERGEEKVS